MSSSKIGVIGLWHLGCILSNCWSKLGHTVVGYDPDKKRVKNLNNGTPPIFEPFLSEGIKENLSKNLLSFSDEASSLKDCDFIFLSYDTPVNEQDESDTTILTDSVNAVKSILKNGAILIVSSQSPVGFCTKLRDLLQKQNLTLEMAYSPENLRLGEAIDCYLNPGRIILGTQNSETEKKCTTLFNEITPDVLSMSLESAELVKHGINSFLAASIVFANNLADICELKNGRIDDVVRGMKSDPRIGSKAYLAPGIGFSGGTLGRDLKVLDGVNNETKGYAKHFGDLHGLNAERKFAIVDKTKKILGGLENKTIGILGLTYKPDTSTLRRSLPLEIVDLLLENKCNIRVFDPKADFNELDYKPKFVITNGIEEVAKDAEILILLTDWKQFKEFTWPSVLKTMKSPIFYDTRNCLNEKAMKQSGFNFYSIGK